MRNTRCLLEPSRLFAGLATAWLLSALVPNALAQAPAEAPPQTAGAATAPAQSMVRFGFLELDKDVRYHEKLLFFRTLSRPLGQPYAGAEVALREARFVGQALGVSFALERVKGKDGADLLAPYILSLRKLLKNYIIGLLPKANEWFGLFPNIRVRKLWITFNRYCPRFII